ncbi:MAG TPA: hypothetical protein PKY10_13565, partial [Lentisphaeria bacterium]|nr:hypothetical protein [Lentisphaeria bacterium]
LQPYRTLAAPLSTNLLFFCERLSSNQRLCITPSGLKIIMHLTQGYAALTQGFYVSALWAFCRFAAVDMVDVVDIVDGARVCSSPRP